MSEYKHKYVPGGERPSSIDHLYRPNIRVKQYLSPSIMRLPELSANHAKRRERITDPLIYDLIYFDKNQKATKKYSEYKFNYSNPDTNAYRSKRNETYVTRCTSPFIKNYSRSQDYLLFQKI